MPAEFVYGVYGVRLRSEFELGLPPPIGPGLVAIVLRRAARGGFDGLVDGVALTTRDEWYEYAHLEDGSSYVRWRDLGEFLVAADGSEIRCIQAEAATDESFQVYLLGQALSFALVKAGFEPLHGTAIVHEGEAIALLGDSGFGKSTLAASFLSAGATLLTDDLLLVRREGARVIAYPGPQRIKLFPDSAARFVPAAEAAPMNSFTNKHILPLQAAMCCPHPAPLRAIYVLAAPAEMRLQRRVAITPLQPRDALLALVANTFNRYIDGPARLTRQFEQLGSLSRSLPVSRLAYPRSTGRLAEVREALIRGPPTPETAAA